MVSPAHRPFSRTRGQESAPRVPNNREEGRPSVTRTSGVPVPPGGELHGTAPRHLSQGEVLRDPVRLLRRNPPATRVSTIVGGAGPPPVLADSALRRHGAGDPPALDPACGPPGYPRSV